MSELKNAQVVADTVDFSVLRPRRPRLIAVSALMGALAGVVYGIFAHSAEAAIIPLDLLLFGTLSALTAWLLDITPANNSSH
ncbi:MAG: hypothetical protein P4L53_09050 [Candidatus Obscuribacterales bacterium]|nr:hypothetical protein [Candidatus Obscuribacterales bacterium]